MEHPDWLSRREQEVVEQLLAGKSNKMIAAALHIAESTVEFHLKNIYSKYGVASRTELILKLGESTVADQAAVAENRDRFSPRGWTWQWKETISRLAKEAGMKIDLNTAARGEGSPLSFTEAIVVCLRKYAQFEGIASRSEFWWFALFITLVTSALSYLSVNLGSVFLIAMLLPLLAAGTRRLRDSGQSGWWQLILLAPVGGLVVMAYLWSLPPVAAPSENLPTG